MFVKVLAYNTFDGFGDRRRARGITDFVAFQDPHVAFFSQAYESSHDVSPVLEQFERMGYRVIAAPYDDGDGRSDAHSFIALSKLHGTIGVRRYGTRSGVFGRFSVTGGVRQRTLSVVGVHLNDRHEAGRLAQVSSLQPLKVPSIVMGDLNAMHGNSPIALVALAARPFIPKASERARRFSDMAEGSTLKRFANRGLHDADRWHRPTARGFAQLDHILITRDIAALDFTVHRDVALSDRKPISAMLSV